MPRKKNESNLTLLCSVAGHKLLLTPGNKIVVQTPKGMASFPYVNHFGQLLFSGPIAAVPPAVEKKIRAALENQKRARALRKAAELSEPPDSMREIHYCY